MSTGKEHHMATGTTNPTPAKEKKVATYLPGKGIPGVTREISKKDAKSTLEVDLDEDLKWSRENNHRVDVTNIPEPLFKLLADDPDFKISSE
jgi:hypothetical protein